MMRLSRSTATHQVADSARHQQPDRLLYTFPGEQPTRNLFASSSRRGFLNMIAGCFLAGRLAAETKGAPRQFPIPGRRPRSQVGEMVLAIELAREALSHENRAIAQYKAALDTNFLSGEAEERVKEARRTHEKHARELKDLLDALGGKYSEEPEPRKDYRWTANARGVIEQLLKQEEMRKDSYSSYAKKTRQPRAKQTFQAMKDDEERHIRIYKELLKKL